MPVMRLPSLPANRYVTYATIVMVGLTVDLLTKHWVFAWLGPRGDNIYWIWEGIFGLQTSLNRGALFGWGQGQVWLFASLSIVAALGIFYWLFIAGEARSLLLTVALSSVTGGILGNLYDRLGLWSHPALPPEHCFAVRDWILFTYQGWTWPNFNVADCLLVGGAGLIICHALVQRPEPTPAPAKG